MKLSSKPDLSWVRRTYILVRCERQNLGRTGRAKLPFVVADFENTYISLFSLIQRIALTIPFASMTALMYNRVGVLN
jgi:hypothetical protein